MPCFTTSKQFHAILWRLAGRKIIIHECIANINQIVICAPGFLVWTLVFQILYIQGSKK
jgi:hypothetical protein